MNLSTNQLVGLLAVVAGILCLALGSGALKIVGVVAILLGLAAVLRQLPRRP